MDNLKLILEILRYINLILGSIPVVILIIKKIIDFIKSKKYSLKDFEQFTNELDNDIKKIKGENENENEKDN